VRLRNLGTVLVTGALLVGLAACGDDDDDAGGATTTAAGAAATTAAGGAATTAAGGDACGAIDITPVEGFEGVKDGTLTVVTSLPGPGFWVGSATDPNEIKAGFEYCMAKAFQAGVGAEDLDVRNESFDAIVAGTITDYDIVLSQVTINDERKQVVDFTIPYFESQQGVLAKAGAKITTLEEAKKTTWGVQTGTTAITLLEDLVKPDSEPAVYQSLADAYTALDAGQVDAVLIDTAINLGQAAASNGELEVVSQFEQPTGPDQYGAIVPKGSPNLAIFDQILAAMEAAGLLDQFATANLSKAPSDIPVIAVT
jgi:polar amino acid transport system substrate-binding protein